MRKKIFFSLAILLTMFITVIFSIVISLASQQLSLRGGIGIHYYASPINYLKTNCTSLTFDYYNPEIHDSIIQSATMNIAVDNNEKGLRDGGVSLFYQPSTASAYVLSYNEIKAGSSCAGMFMGWTRLETIVFNNFDTTNATNMGNMFRNCYALTNLDLSNFNTSKVTRMRCMFEYCESLTNLDLSSFETLSVTDMDSMFFQCHALTNLNLSNFNTSKVTDMSSMFNRCYALTSLDLSSFNTSNVTNMTSMFYLCNKLTTIYAGIGWLTDAVTSSSYMFTGCSSLVGGEGTKVSSYIDKTYARVDGGSSNPGYLTLSTPATLMSGSAFNLKIPSDCTEVIFDRYGLYASKFYWLSGESVSVDASGNTTAEIKTFEDGTKLYVLSKGKIYANPDCSYMFREKTKILSITFNNFNTSNVTNMSYMFEVGYNYTSESSGTERIIGELNSIVGLHRFNTSNVTDMSGMFYWCLKLTELDLSSFNTSNVTNMGAMFFNCNNLTKLDVSNFNTSNVTTMGGMFFNCYNLTKLDVTNFNTSNVTVMAVMFMGCEGLTELDLSSFNTAKVTAMNYMFQFCENLKTIYVGDDWATDSVETSDLMFAGCTSLVGGEGTTVINSSYVDKTYARVDGGPSNPGYLTLKQ